MVGELQEWVCRFLLNPEPDVFTRLRALLALTELQGLENLCSVGTLHVCHNAEILTLDGLQGLERADRVILHGNLKLKHVKALQACHPKVVLVRNIPTLSTRKHWSCLRSALSIMTFKSLFPAMVAESPDTRTGRVADRIACGCLGESLAMCRGIAAKPVGISAKIV